MYVKGQIGLQDLWWMYAQLSSHGSAISTALLMQVQRVLDPRLHHHSTVYCWKH